MIQKSSLHKGPLNWTDNLFQDRFKAIGQNFRNDLHENVATGLGAIFLNSLWVFAFGQQYQGGGIKLL